MSPHTRHRRRGTRSSFESGCSMSLHMSPSGVVVDEQNCWSGEPGDAAADAATVVEVAPGVDAAADAGKAVETVAAEAAACIGSHLKSMEAAAAAAVASPIGW